MELVDSRKCRVCGDICPTNEMASAGIINGVQYYRYKCKKCYHSFKNKRRNRIAVQVAEYKKTLKCVRCGFSDYRALQFHHSKGDKKYEVANMAGFAFENILKEISKCEVLCANCHFIEHYKV